ncbi:peptidylprolyl isomerase [Mycolicibacterium sp. XJ870]
MTFPPPYGGYQPEHSGYPAGYQPGLPPPRTNGMAVASLVCAFLFAPLGIVFGHVSLSQINRSGEQGRGMAMAGLVLSYVMTAVSVVVAVVLALFVVAAGDKTEERRPDTETYSAAPQSDGSLPAFDPPANLGANCQYPAEGTAAKPAKPPRTGRVPTDPATVTASITADRGNIGLELANGQAPCTVNNFASLAQQGFFDDTPCHRLTTGSLSVLQCGDPSGSGTGGPGYQFANEYPTNQLSDSAQLTPVVYPRGTLAMANAGPGTNGSQFFLVYEDSLLPPAYTVFGTVDNTGLATLDRIAEGGVAGGSQDGEPATPVRIISAGLD